MRHRVLVPLLLLPVALFLGAESAQSARTPAATFRPLGDLPGGIFHSIPTGVSDDGQVVVGSSYGRNGGLESRAFRWTPTGGIVALPHLPGSTRTGANDVSADGQVIVGASGSGDTSIENRAVRWTSTGQVEYLGKLAEGEPGQSDAFAVSADGNTVVGSSVNEFGGNQAFRWTATGGMQAIPFLYGGQLFGFAFDVSADGNTVVGFSDMLFPGGFIFHHRHAFRWTPETGTVDLHPSDWLRDMVGASRANAVSPDGQHVVGELELVSGFFWSPTQPTTELPTLPTRPAHERYAIAFGVSADGSRIVGSSHLAPRRSGGRGGLQPGPWRAVIWDADRRVQDLQKLLARYRVRLRGWWLTEATDVTPDGRTIIGYGTNPAGQEEGWIVTLPTGG